MCATDGGDSRPQAVDDSRVCYTGAMDYVSDEELDRYRNGGNKPLLNEEVLAELRAHPGRWGKLAKKASYTAASTTCTKQRVRASELQIELRTWQDESGQHWVLARAVYTRP